jgi:aminopeptidase I
MCFFQAVLVPGAAKPEAFTQPFCDFLTENPTVFHAVDYFKRTTRIMGYQEVRP